jgi:hypothetical protein
MENMALLPLPGSRLTDSGAIDRHSNLFDTLLLLLFVTVLL